MGRTHLEALLSELWLRHPLQMLMFVCHISRFFFPSCVNVILRYSSDVHPSVFPFSRHWSIGCILRGTPSILAIKLTQMLRVCKCVCIGLHMHCWSSECKLSVHTVPSSLVMEERWDTGTGPRCDAPVELTRQTNSMFTVLYAARLWSVIAVNR